MIHTHTGRVDQVLGNCLMDHGGGHDPGYLRPINVECAGETFGLVAVGQHIPIQELLERLEVELRAGAQGKLRDALHIALQPGSKRLLGRRNRHMITQRFARLLIEVGEPVQDVRLNMIKLCRDNGEEASGADVQTLRIVDQRALLFHSGAEDSYGK